MPQLHVQHALLETGWQRDVLITIEGRRIAAIEAGASAPARSGAARGHRRARHRQCAQPCLPACHGGPRRAARAGGRQLLDLARGHVPLPRAHDARRRRGDRRVGLRGDAGGGLHRRSASSTTCTTPPTARATPIPPRWPRASSRRRRRPASGSRCCRASTPMAAAAVSPPSPGRRASCRTSTSFWRLMEASRTPSRQARRRGARHRAAFAARGRCGGAAGAGRARGRRDRSTSTRPSRRGEVEECIAWSGARPVQWLLDNMAVDARWCLIHCDAHDTARRAAAWPAQAPWPVSAPSPRPTSATASSRRRGFCEAGGRIAIGTDSNVRISRRRGAAHARVRPAPARAENAIAWVPPVRPRGGISSISPAPAARRRWASTAACSRCGNVPTSWCSTRSIPR